VAAGQAIEAISKNVPQWDPPPPVPGQTPVPPKKKDQEENSKLLFDSFDIYSVIKNGTLLLANAGKDYEFDFGDLDARERLALQKRDLKKRLGIATQFMDVDLISDADIITSPVTVKNEIKSEGVKNVKMEEAEPVVLDKEALKKLSPRERNLLKRRARMAAKDKSKEKGRNVDIAVSSSRKRKINSADSSDVSSSTKVKKENNQEDKSGVKSENSDNNKVVVKHKENTEKIFHSGVYNPGDEWPFEGLCEQLCMDLFSPVWEVRHGAGIGLREILKTQGSGIGKIVGETSSQNEINHKKALEDLCIRLLCVLALDRFADYVSDQVVVPVRETCAQTLGVVMQWCSKDICLKVVNNGLLSLINFSKKNEITTGQWEIRHAGLIGLKYWMAVRKDLVSDILLTHDKEGAYNAIIDGLKDSNDDVRAVSSSTLLPICDILVEKIPARELYDTIVKNLWDCLEDLDDLTSATGSVMDLLSQLVIKDQIRNIIKIDNQINLKSLFPRLYPFFRHAVISVRIATLKCINVLVDVGMDDRFEEDESWISLELLRLVFQNFLIEENKQILELTLNTWTHILEYFDNKRIKKNDIENQRIISTVYPMLTAWFSLTLTPVGTPLDWKLFYSTNCSSYGNGNGIPMVSSMDELNINSQDRSMILQDLTILKTEDIIYGRIISAIALGRLLSILLMNFRGDSLNPQHQLCQLVKAIFLNYENSIWSYQRTYMNIILEEWAIWDSELKKKDNVVNNKNLPLVESSILANEIWNILITVLTKASTANGMNILFCEQVNSLSKLRTDTQLLLNCFIDLGVKEVPKLLPLPNNTNMTEQFQEQQQIFNFETAVHIANTLYPNLVSMIPQSYTARSKTDQALKDKFNQLQPLIEQLQFSIINYENSKQSIDIQILASMSDAVIRFGRLPDKLNPIIRSLMNSIKLEHNEFYQKRSACCISKLISMNIENGRMLNANEKIVKNLCTFLCSDSRVVRIIEKEKNVSDIITMEMLQNPLEENHNSHNNKRKKINIDSAALSVVDESTKEDGDEAENLAKSIIRRGANMALEELCKAFGSELFNKIPKIWENLVNSIQIFSNTEEIEQTNKYLTENVSEAQKIVNSLYILKTIIPHVDKNIHTIITGQLETICNTLRSNFSIVRNMAAQCLASLALYVTVPTMKCLIQRVLPMLGETKNPVSRQASIEAIYHVVTEMEIKILPYIIFLIIPILGRMSDPDESVRFISTNIFATLIKLMPLESGIPDSEGLDEELVKQKVEERQFMSQLIGNKQIDDFKFPEGVVINAELRKYQKEGVNWLAFLTRYGLHGILCDDMGLGKTLQSICILAINHFTQKKKYEETGSPEFKPNPSIVVCPPTLTGHWYQEIKQYTNNIRPILYQGGPSERSRLRGVIKKYDVVIISYDILRNDIEELGKIDYNFCILDEGHIIKNPKTKLTKAVKSLHVMHRLILSGTPIQNNVLELWSLFDFLMPGFLGTERQFNEKYGKPILSSRDSKSSSREQENGALALEALHRQVLPFLLRRMKEDVLNDLPPKIIQDYYCELSEIQKILYEDFAKSQTKNELSNEIQERSTQKSKSKNSKGPASHIFQALQYLRKLCNHPVLVLNPSHPKYNEVNQKLKEQNIPLNDIRNAPKLMALRQLLLDCGIGIENTNEQTVTVSQHRALIFCQLKPMLDIIENDLFKKWMPSVTYYRLDGSVDSNKRQEIVTNFNKDPSIDCLLLTTHVGGLGLNLTGADTVIFVEHDWNPMKDLQAMDRAHRIGQKCVVNVYRLITRGTLEEKIMGLQKFKLNIASSVVNQDNSSLSSMDSEQILDLFTLSPDRGSSSNEKTIDPNKKASVKEVLEDLEGLWDEKQYEEEFNLDDFLGKLK
jgi:TATA-binding protein-associated factor